MKEIFAVMLALLAAFALTLTAAVAGDDQAVHRSHHMAPLQASSVN